jgi:hypothetical protein
MHKPTSYGNNDAHTSRRLVFDRSIDRLIERERARENESERERTSERERAREKGGWPCTVRV